MMKKGLARDIGGTIKKFLPCSRVVVVTTPVLLSLYQSSLGLSFRKAGIAVEWIEVLEGESSKSLQVAGSLYRQLLELEVDRYTPLIACGGGVIGDLAGFVAGTYLRGLPFVQVPTTLVSQVDSSIGGKAGVDLPEGKNLVGIFYQPSLVLCDPQLLLTLPDREFSSGMAEVIKMAAILSPSLFSSLEKKGKKIKKTSTALLQEMIRESVMLKILVVEKDPFDHGERELLNFGHTIGHALEALTGYSQWSHGEAISIGMSLETRIAEKMKICSRDLKRRLVEVLEQFSLPVSCRDFPLHGLEEAMLKDKKRRDGTIRMVLPHLVGKGKVHDVSFSLVQEVVEESGGLPRPVP